MRITTNFINDFSEASVSNNLGHADTPSNRGAAQIKRRRATRACLGCRARKVRCNVTENDGPCTNCRLDRLECVVRRRKRSRPQQFQIHCFKQDPNYLSTQPKNVITIEDNGGLLDEEQDQDSLLTPSEMQLDLFSGSQLVDGVPSASAIFDSMNEMVSNEDFASANNQMHVLGLSTGTTNFSTESIVLKITSNNPGPALPTYIKSLDGQVAKEDIEYLHQKGALAIPDLELRNALLQGFVEYVYPFMPVVDLQQFVEIVGQGDGQNGKLSLLLFQAVMFAGSAFIDMKHLSTAGYVSRRVARRALFRKLRLLYEFDAEACMISRCQSLLLMTYYFNRPNEQKDLWFYNNVVVSLAQSAGLQRDPKNDLIPLPLREQHLRKRIWWSIFMRDQMIALGMRRPPRIGMDDYNVPRLTLEDFECDADLTQLSIMAPSCTMARDVFQRRQLAIMCMEKAKLCILIGLVLSSQYTIAQVGHPKTDLLPKGIPSTNQQGRRCLQELGTWNANLPRICVYDSSTALSQCESPLMIIHKAILRMIYLTTLSAVYRPEVLPVCPWSTTTTRPLHPKATDLVDPGQAAIRRAANETACIAQDLQSLDLVRFLPTTVVTALLPAMMIHLLDIRSKTSQAAAIMPSFHLFGGCMKAMHLLHEMYASADFAIEFIEDSAKKAKVDITFLISPRATNLILSSNNTFFANESDSSSNGSSITRRDMVQLSGRKQSLSSVLSDAISCVAPGDRYTFSKQSSRHDLDPLNFLNLTNEISGVSSRSLSTSSQNQSDLQEPVEEWIDLNVLNCDSRFQDLDVLDNIGDTNISVHDTAALTADTSIGNLDIASGYDLDFGELFRTTT